MFRTTQQRWRTKPGSSLRTRIPTRLASAGGNDSGDMASRQRSCRGLPCRATRHGAGPRGLRSLQCSARKVSRKGWSQPGSGIVFGEPLTYGISGRQQLLTEKTVDLGRLLRRQRGLCISPPAGRSSSFTAYKRVGTGRLSAVACGAQSVQRISHLPTCLPAQQNCSPSSSLVCEPDAF